MLARRIVLEEAHFDLANADALTAKWLYIGYIVSVALVDISALMRLIPDIAAWIHVLVTLILSAFAVGCITMYVRTHERTTRYRTDMLRHLMNAHNERATALDVGPM